MTVSVEQVSSFARNFNPLSPAAVPRWPTIAGVYEPLLVFNSVKGEYVPWLASSYEWLENGRVLRFHIREGVRWSDGAPFTARDVLFTFQLIRDTPSVDRSGIFTFVDKVTAHDGVVEFEFPRVFLPGLYEIAPQPIVPEHVWKNVKDPLTFQNENPVATGPFTEVRVFENQIFELGRNPYYWQPGKPKVDALRFPAYPSNERANLALVFDEADWAANFVPAIDRVYTRRDPEHHKHWFPLTGSMVFLYANTTRPPFDRLEVRKGLSLAIDRDLLIQVADYGYTRPADATGLSDAYARWRNPSLAIPLSHDSARAKELLKPLNRPVEILSVAGWSDWVRAAQVIARNLKEVGIPAVVKTYDFAAWYQRVEEGNFDLSIGWSMEGPTPYTFYRWQMSSATKRPLGQLAVGNWQRYSSQRADEALAKFEREPDAEKQRALVDELQRIFVEEAPAIPLYPNPSWAEYNTRRFTNFPSAANPYSDPSPNKWDQRECLITLTNIEPVQ
jgi:peptide/nickel transport system substrate-binding protein